MSRCLGAERRKTSTACRPIHTSVRLREQGGPGPGTVPGMTTNRMEGIHDPAQWDEVEREQRGVVTAAQAYAAFGKSFVQHQVRARRWQRPCRGVIVAHNGPIDEAERTMIALLSCAPGAVVAGLTALREDGFSGFEGLDARPRILLPNGARRSGNRDVSVHWSASLGSADADFNRIPPRTRPARSAVNEASWSGPPRLARALILSAVQQRMCRPGDILECLAMLPNCCHHGIIRESAMDAAGGTQSLPEGDFLRLCTSNGAPPPSRQVMCRRPDGRYFLDVAWREYDLGRVC